MTIKELYNSGSKLLEDANKDNAAFDARYLIEFAMNADNQNFFIKMNDDADTELISLFYSLIRRRAAGEPLQYIVGSWDFMDCSFFVGSGVLIPRPETELLAEFSIKYIEKIKNPVVFDLCSGSGCLGISIGKAVPDATVFAVEKYDEALYFLNKNIKRNQVSNVKALQGDIFDNRLLSYIRPDLIVSNPPYIRTADLPFLQAEVQQEPFSALDGGNDGYDYYRFLVSHWFGKLNKNGAMVLECAEDQAEEISSLLLSSGGKTKITKDLSGYPRMVTAIK